VQAEGPLTESQERYLHKNMIRRIERALIRSGWKYRSAEVQAGSGCEDGSPVSGQDDCEEG
jgi:hypothetical protein